MKKEQRDDFERRLRIAEGYLDKANSLGVKFKDRQLKRLWRALPSYYRGSSSDLFAEIYSSHLRLSGDGLRIEEHDILKEIIYKKNPLLESLKSNEGFAGVNITIPFKMD